MTSQFALSSLNWAEWQTGSNGETGAAISIASEKTVRKLLPGLALNQSTVMLKTYMGEKMPVKYDTTLTLHVIKGEGPTLETRLAEVYQNGLENHWNSYLGEWTIQVDSLLQKHQDVFIKEVLGTMKAFQAQYVQAEAKPKFHKPRPVPYAIKEAIELELDLLEGARVRERVTYSRWAAPILPVPKGDCRIRICADYKVTVNQALNIDQYPLLKPDDLFVALAGGQKFSRHKLLNGWPWKKTVASLSQTTLIKACIAILDFHLVSHQHLTYYPARACAKRG